jgi:hypothetical protein
MVTDGNVKLNGSGVTGGDEDGGTLNATAEGDVTFTSTVAIFANALTGSAGDGGSLEFDGGASGDVSLAGPIDATSGSEGGVGGRLVAVAGGDVAITTGDSVMLNGKHAGGGITIDAGGTYIQSANIFADAESAGGSGGTADVEACTISMTSTARLETNGTIGGQITLTGRDHVDVAAGARVKATGTDGGIELVTRSFGTCSNDPTVHCLASADCTVGCETATCQNVNPDTHGTTVQFDPAPQFVEEPSLAACQ